MRITRIVSVFVALLAVAAFAAAQAENPELRKQVEAVYAKWDRLTAKKDLDGLWELIDPSFVGVDLDGNRATAAEAKKHLAEILKQTHDLKSRIKVDQVQGNHDEVVAWVTMTVTWKEKVDGKMEQMKFTAKFAETLKRTKDGWRFTFSQMLPNS
jgi:ketosteroid isomerase-like protein